MKVRYSLRFRILLAFTFLSFICAIAYGFTSSFISEVVNDRLFNWYAVNDARNIAKEGRLPEDDELRYFVYGDETDLYSFLVETFNLDEPLTERMFIGMSSLANVEHLNNGDVLYEFKFGEDLLQVTSVPRDGQRQFVAYNITGFSAYENSSGILSDTNTHWLMILLTMFVTIIGLIIGIFLFHKVMSPLIQLSNTVANANPDSIPPELSSMFYPDEVGKVARTIEHLLIRIEKYVDHERRFSREVSHELRTPITTINISLELLNQLDLTPQQNKMVDRITRANQDMLHLVQTFLLLGRQSFDSVEEESTRLDVLISDILEKHQHILNGKNVSINVDKNRPIEVKVYSFLLDTVVSNLVRNAFQYTSDGEVRIETDKRSVRIIDTGSGIPKDELARISEPYHKLQPEGIGLGLSIVQRIVEKMDWELSISSVEGKGTTVTIDFGRCSLTQEVTA